MPKIVDAGAQRARIRKAAMGVFAERGLAGTGLAHVAARAGLSRASLYHYYIDKAALLEDLARHLLADEERLFAEALRRDGPVRERLQTLAERVVARFGQWAAFGRPLLEIWARDLSALKPLLRQLRAALGTMIEQGQKSGEIDPALDPEATAMLVIGLIDGLMLQVMVDPGGTPAMAVMQKALAQALQRIIEPEAGP